MWQILEHTGIQYFFFLIFWLHCAEPKTTLGVWMTFLVLFHPGGPDRLKIPCLEVFSRPSKEHKHPRKPNKDYSKLAKHQKKITDQKQYTQLFLVLVLVLADFQRKRLRFLFTKKRLHSSGGFAECQLVGCGDARAGPKGWIRSRKLQKMPFIRLLLGSLCYFLWVL